MITEQPRVWDRIVDVVVLGSGAAGLVAATLANDGGAEVLVLEKSDLVGGTTGVSGGMPWIPLNRHMADVGVDDTRDEATRYIRRRFSRFPTLPRLLTWSFGPRTGRP